MVRPDDELRGPWQLSQEQMDISSIVFDLIVLLTIIRTILFQQTWQFKEEEKMNPLFLLLNRNVQLLVH